MLNDVVALLRALVRIDSTSRKSNLAVADLLEERLRPAGIHCHRQLWVDANGVDKCNLFAALGAGRPEIALVGHMDCVPFDEDWSDALELTQRGDTWVGRGACDTKGFVAAATIAALRVHAELKRPALLAFTADEEVGCVGASRWVDARTPLPLRAIIGEPTSLRPVRASKGYCLGAVRVRGTEAHSAYPASGASAIARAARLIGRIEHWAKVVLSRERNPEFNPPYGTINIGMIAGGKATNIVPGDCTFSLEWRPLPGQEVAHFVAGVEACIAECHNEDAGFDASLMLEVSDAGFATPCDDPLVRLLERASGHTATLVAFGTEAPGLQELGAIPVVFGPGDIHSAHRSGEFVSSSDLVGAERALEAALRAFAGS